MEEMNYPFRTGNGSTGNLDPYGDPFDPQNPHYGKDVFATSSMIDGGMAPQSGFMYRGTNMPAVPKGQKGYYTLVNTAPGLRTMNDGILDTGAQDNTWRFVGEEQSMAPQGAPEEQQQAQRPVADPNGKTIYNDWDTFRSTAQAEVGAGDFSPGVLNPRDLIGLDANQQMQKFYPGAWQDSGVQKVIGPNGTNIAPKLQEDGILDQFRPGTGNANTATARDYPTLVELLQNTGKITPEQSQILLGLAKPKVPDQSFAQLGMTGGGGQALLGGGFR